MAGKGGRGRTRKAGSRTKGGRLIVPHDYGNLRVVELDAEYAGLQGGKAMPWARDSAIGRAWAWGLLDGYGVDPTVLRDAGLQFASLHHSYGFRNAMVANYEGEDRRGGQGVANPVLIGGVEVPRDGSGMLFQKIDGIIKDSGWASTDAVYGLCCDYHTRPWENPPWLDRLINKAKLLKGRNVAGHLPHQDGRDDRLLKLAVEALLAVVQGTQQRRVA